MAEWRSYVAARMICNRHIEDESLLFAASHLSCGSHRYVREESYERPRLPEETGEVGEVQKDSGDLRCRPRERQPWSGHFCETVIRRMLDPDHSTKSAKLQAALEELGQTVMMAVEDAA